jgi:hypothetical protein
LFNVKISFAKFTKKDVLPIFGFAATVIVLPGVTCIEFIIGKPKFILYLEASLFFSSSRAIFSSVK